MSFIVYKRDNFMRFGPADDFPKTSLSSSFTDDVCNEPSFFFFSSNHLEKSLQLLMDRVDDMSQDIVKFNTYSRNVTKQQQQKHQVTVVPAHTHARPSQPLTQTSTADIISPAFIFGNESQKYPHSQTLGFKTLRRL